MVLPLITVLAFHLYKTTFHAGASRRIHALKKKVMTLRHDLTNTSAQDEFARWAKLKRSLDKSVAEFETLSKEQSFSRTVFETQVSWCLRIFMWIAQFILMSMYRYEPIFYIPEGWLGPFTFLLAFPFAPKGSVSVYCWFYACKNVTRRLLQGFQ
ncbi:hypothetical protein SeLEV6574_g03986 [Synchytrium endobioticum]|uniref:Guided entry of tail-anchored proteins 1 n=1 Tax=Synchytrium endobioticum TaxID=286115 RepID=A0A507D1M4_9FUNG|nr:hypothetical protein SeLEV6574_g03986 [Synchytrium endobioticum]